MLRTCLAVLLLSGLATADPSPKPAKPASLPSLPVIQVNTASPEESGPLLPQNGGSTIELPPTTGPGAPRMRVRGRRYLGGPFGMPGSQYSLPSSTTGAPNAGPGAGVLSPGRVYP